MVCGPCIGIVWSNLQYLQAFTSMLVLCVGLQACFDSIRLRLGQCQLDHFELPCAADMSPMQVRTTAMLDCQHKKLVSKEHSHVHPA
jgi:hypothetical protein